MSELAAIAITPIGDRNGQSLRNHLIDRLTPYGVPREPLYRLDIRLGRATQDLGIRKDNTATRAKLVESASYQLFNQDGSSVMHGSARAVASYNILEAHYATVVAETDAEERALGALAEEIATQIAAFFAGGRHRAPPEPAPVP